MTEPIYIFDLDGTLALIDHRVSLLEDKSNPQRWQDFFAACDKDKPNTPVIQTMEALRMTGAQILVFSGRSAEVRDKTVAWLAEHTSFMADELDDSVLTMRKEGDYTPDDELKKRWLENLSDRNRIVAVFDDRDRVVKMWRDNGITCFQVAPGAF